MLKNIIKILVSLALFGYFGWVLAGQWRAYSDDLDLLWHEATTLTFPLMGLVCCFTFAMLVRSHRWALTLGRPDLLWPSFRSISIAYLVQCPLSKFGEVVRIANQKRITGLSTGALVSTVLIDRLLDIFAMVLVLFASLWAGEGLIEDHFPQLTSLIPKLGVLMLLGLVAFGAFLILHRRIGSWIEQRAWPEKPKRLLVDFIHQFGEGMQHLKGWKAAGYFFFSSLAIWVSYVGCFFFTVTFFPSFPESDPKQLLVLFTVASVGVLIPVPGGLAYPIFFKKALLIIHPEIEASVAFSLGLFCYFINFWGINLLVGGSCWIYQLIFDGRARDGYET